MGVDVTWEAVDFNLERQRLRVKGRLDEYELSIPLLGEYQLVNAAMAVAALEVLKDKGGRITRDNIAGGMARVSWPGRLQVVGRSPVIVVDGAHNPDAARRLKESLGRYFDFDRAILIIGASVDKDITSIVSELAPVFNRVIAARSRHPRTMAPARIAAEFARYEVETEVADGVAQALSRSLSMAGARDLICVAGSLFVVAEAIEEANKLHLTG